MERSARLFATGLTCSNLPRLNAVALQVTPCGETHIHGFQTQWKDDAGRVASLYLHTSPEFSCKKLLAAGERKIWDFARVYRNGEVGPLHAPEFTMVEWYRVGAKLSDVMGDCTALVIEAAAAQGHSQLRWRDLACDLRKAPECLTLTDAFDRYAGIDLEAVLEDRDAFAAAAMRAGVGVREDTGWSDIFSAVLVARIEPELGQGQLTFLHRYPICEAALARPCEDDPRFADRFELYACGIELANGFDELTDAAEQRRRFVEAMDEREAIYGERYPLDEEFLEAVAMMPPCSGVAMGFERLVMLASGARHINDVQWTPWSHKGQVV